MKYVLDNKSRNMYWITDHEIWKIDFESLTININNFKIKN